MDANTQQQDALGLQPGARGNSKGKRGRKNSDGSEEVLDVESLKEAAPKLMKKLRKALKTLGAVNDEIKLVCEANGANTAQFKRALKAGIKGDHEDLRRKAEQQAILFEAIGTVSEEPEADLAS